MIEPIEMTTALIASVVSPLVLDGLLRVRPVWAWLGSVVIANIAIESVFSFLRPDFHDGPLSGLAIIMYIVITSIIVALVLTILRTFRKTSTPLVEPTDDR